MSFMVGSNEAARLEALQGLNLRRGRFDPRNAAALGPLDLRHDRPDQVLARLVALAQARFEVPIVLISIVDEHEQWFASRLGLAVCATPREHAFCNRTILNDDVLVVEDACTSPDFADNPFVTGEPRIRFYAGAPLILRPGIRLGSLCLIDTRPRAFDEAERRWLRSLATSAMAILELRSAPVTDAAD